MSSSINDGLKAPEHSNEEKELELWMKIDTAGSIDEIIQIISTFEARIPLKQVGRYGPQEVETIAVENIRKKIERIRHGHEIVGAAEPEPPHPTLDHWLAAKKFNELEKVLPNFAGLREAVRKLLSSDHVYQQYTQGPKAKTPKKTASQRDKKYRTGRVKIQDDPQKAERERKSEEAKRRLEEQRAEALAHERKLAQDRQNPSRKQQLRLQRNGGKH